MAKIGHVVLLSGGKDSTAMALRLAEVEPRPYTYLCTPTGNELPPMLDHWKHLEHLLGAPLQRVGERTLMGLILEQTALPNWRQRWCTRILKIEAFKGWLLNHLPAVAYVGLRADEAGREGVAYSEGDIRTGLVQRYPLSEWGWDLTRVRQYLADRGVTVPTRTDCALCFFQRLGEWYRLWLDYPEEWAKGEEVERLTGHTFRSPGRDSWPAAMEGLRQEFEAGHVPTSEVQLRMFDAVAESKCRMCSI